MTIPMEINLLEKSLEKQPKDDLSLTKSKQILLALDLKLKQQKNDFPTLNITLTRFKNLFLEGCRSNNSVLDGFARINMFTRILNNGALASEFKKTFGKLIPNDVDLENAKNDIQTFDINFEIESFDELYFSDGKQLSILEIFL